MITSFIHLIIWLLIIGVLVAIVYYVVRAIPVPEPIGRWVIILVTVIACILILLLLLQMVGVSVPHQPFLGLE